MSRRIEVHICAHYVEARIPFLCIVLDAMLGWRDCTVEAVVTTNTDAHAHQPFWPEFQQRFAAAGHRLSLEVVSGLPDPFELTWADKRHIKPWIAQAQPNDLFIYIEDDITLTADNLDYFTQTLKTTRKRSLIPGFLRFETKDGERRLVDINEPENWNIERNVVIDGTTFHACLNPYWAGFILDREMAEEYVASRSSSMTGSEFWHWDIRARAAMGLTYERPDPALKSRVVIPFIDGKPDPACYLWHCANNYSVMPDTAFARLTPEAAFRRESLPGLVVRKVGRKIGKLVRRA